MIDQIEHLIVDNLLSLDSAKELELLAKGEDRWKLHEESFFSQNDFSWVRRESGRPAVGNATPPMGELLKKGSELFESKFNSVIGRKFTIVGHKMIPGQVVGIHNDSPERDRGRMENFRLVYYLDRDFQDDKGGHLILFSDKNGSHIIDAVRPIFNSAILLKLSDTSYHAVHTVKKEIRYSIVVSYWGYPILFSSPDKKAKVEKLLRLIIDAGLEEVSHSGTTFAYHLYNTFRQLYDWGQDIDTCLAGLAHSLLGRRSSGILSRQVPPSELLTIIGDRAYSIVHELSSHSGFSRDPQNASWPSKSAYIIELANLLEQANDESDLSEVIQRANSLPEIAPLIAGEIAMNFKSRKSEKLL